MDEPSALVRPSGDAALMPRNGSQGPARRIHRTSSLLSAVSISTFLAVIVAASLQHSLATPTFHLDGAFQTASGLYRLADGQRPGLDFFPYLGVGPLFAIYPLFWLTGSHLGASVFAAHAATLLSGWMATTTVVFLTFKTIRLLNAAAIGAIMFTLILLYSSQIGFAFPFEWALEPGNSLRPIRAALPYVVALLMALVAMRVKPGIARSSSLGMILGLCPLWSNDFALPTLLVFGGWALIVAIRDGRTDWARQLAFLSGSFIVTGLLLMLLATAGNVYELIRYNIFDVAGDQWWYFGDYSETLRIFDLTDLPRMWDPRMIIPLAAILLSSFLAFRTRQIGYGLNSLVGVTLLLGGIVPSVGGHISTYFGGFFLWGALTALVISGRAFQSLITEERAAGLIPSSHTRWLWFGAVALFIASSLPISVSNYLGARTDIEADSEYFFVPELGSHIGTEWRDYIELARKEASTPVVEEYWGIWSATTRRDSLWQVDSAIHALGSNRADSQDALSSAEFIITTRLSLSEEWQPWSVSQNFWLYDPLLSDWEPVFKSPTTVVWSPRESGGPLQEVRCNVSKDGRSLSLGSSANGYYRVEVRYTPVGSGSRSLLFLENNISFAANANGRVSLDPKGDSAILPILKTGDMDHRFDLTRLGDGGEQARLVSCEATRIDFNDPDVLIPPEAKHPESNDSE